MNNPTLSEKLYKLKSDKSMTNPALAKHIGISLQTLTNQLHNRFDPSPDTLLLIQKALGEKSTIEDIPKNLKKLMRTKGMTIIELSDFLEVPSATLRTWLKGNKFPSYPYILKLSEVFELEGVV